MKSEHAKRLRHPVITLLAAGMAIVFFAGSACAGQRGRDLPAAVRVVLDQVNRFIETADYDSAVQRLTAFQARGGPPPAENDTTSVYHHPMIDLVLGSCLLHQERHADAEAALIRATRRMPERIAAWLNLAKACYEQGKFAEAAVHFAAAYDHADEKQPEYLYYSAAACLMAEKYKDAVGAFERLLSDHPQQIKPAWRAHWVNALLADGQAHQALPHIRTLIEQYDGQERVRWQEMLLHQYIQLDMRDQARGYAHALT
ncbi:MAG: tetratricopeptide repeat protein, partial [Desulfatitalea sp.]|nr:tetratricopeptide repeat protein [Desulfatitalea sp.]NNK00182.1 tetratricopeptide repeat protein [Desulfatitalea sp.]